MKHFIRGSVAALALCAATGALPAWADETSASLNVNATVTANCSVSTTPVAFGNIDLTAGQPALATGGISVLCTSGTAWTAAADTGTGAGAAFSARKMASGSDLLNYELFTDAGHTALWGDNDGDGTSVFSGTGTGTTQSKTIYGRVPAGQTSLPAGDYADTVNVTVTY